MISKSSYYGTGKNIFIFQKKNIYVIISTMFKKVNQKQKFPELEKDILKFWKENQIFKKSIEERPADKTFSFYDGPPFATGTPHYGHLVSGTIKDVIPRFKTMQGYRVERIWGWDSHGLPIEFEIEKKLGLSGKKDIEDYGISKFNEECRKTVLEYADIWEKIVERTGRWVDMENYYITMNPDFMESVWWVFKSLYEKSFVYEGHKVLPYCPRCATALSNFETNQGYAEKKDTTLTVKFKLLDQENTYLLAWTTTPWTLPSNLALAVGENIRYVKKKIGRDTYILAEERIGNYFPEEAGEERENPEEDLEFILSRELIGLTYEPLFPYYKDLRKEGAFRVVSGEFVSTEEGTGIVHIAPAFGEDDNRVGQKEGLPFVDPVDESGNFTEVVEDFRGLNVVEKDTNEKIAEKLAEKVFKKETYVHNYPFCWRCDTALIYKGVPSWFVKVVEIKDQMLKNTEKVKWVPEAIKNRMLRGIESAPDWAISRNRYWGSVIPVWKCSKDNCSEIKVIGSIRELEELSGKKADDLHRHNLDDISLDCRCGGKMKRVSEVLDCWFESGSVPYGRLHYPFENKENFEKQFPADFIAEGQDQTRGWFYTMQVLSTALLGKTAYKNVVVNGIVLAEDGKKMSKHLKNYPEVTEVLDKYGADAMRYYLMDSPGVKAEDLRFSEKGVDEVVKKVVLTLWNTYSFFVTYTNIDGFKPSKGKGLSLQGNKLDHWILSELNVLVRDATNSLEDYEINKATKHLSAFLDNLSNWYVRRSRRRFWKSENDADKSQAYQTLYDCLVTFTKLLAPYMPFVTEEIYKNLTGEESVHLSDWPKADENMIDEKINKKMAKTRAIVNFGLAARGKQNIKVRQPLSKIIVFSNDGIELDKDLVGAIKEELNLKEIEFKKEDPSIVEKVIKLDFTKAGPKFGPKVKEINKAIINGEYEIVEEGVKVGGELLSNEEVILNFRSKSDEYVVEGNGHILVALDVMVSDELKQEGIARDLVRIIQDLRKKEDFDVADRINISYETDSAVLKPIIEKFDDYIRKETLAESIKLGNNGVEEIVLEKEKLSLHLEKVL